MPNVELIFDHDCPNIAGTRAALRRAMSAVGLAPTWREWDRTDPNSPAYARPYGSPTILVDGHDISGQEPADAPSCRIYNCERGRSRGVPEVELIIAALTRATGKNRRNGGALGALSILPAAGAALLPNLTCPACWPAYAGLLSSLGIGFINYTPYLLPSTALFLAITLGTLAYRAKQRWGYRPLALGSAAAALVVAGRFLFDSNTAAYGGLALLAAALLWNAWPRATAAQCPACVSSVRKP